jgi:hypothetical protein
MGPGAVMVAFGNAAIAISLLPDDALHPVLFVTVTERITSPDTPAVYVILSVPLPAVIVPFVMLQA